MPRQESLCFLPATFEYEERARSIHYEAIEALLGFKLRRVAAASKQDHDFIGKPHDLRSPQLSYLVKSMQPIS